MLTAEQRAAYERDGFLAVPGVVAREECAALVDRAAHIAAQAPADLSVFTTDDQQRVSDERFLASGPQVTCFTEPDGVTLAKIGHALHDLDPVFAPFSRRRDFAALLADVGMTEPLLLQSMYLCKAARSGGEVGSHQDATFMYTDPVTVLGLWVALEDATVENGCLWAEPGGHRRPLHAHFVREGMTTRMVTLDPAPLPTEGLLPLACGKGALVLLHGQLPHRSGPNLSDRSRHAYALHLIDADCRYSPDNWLQRRPDMPLRGF